MLDGTYAGVEESIAGFLNRTDLTARIPDFIVLAEAQMQRRFVSRVKDGLSIPRRLVTTSTPALALAAEFSTLPTDYVGAKSFTITGADASVKELQYISPDELASEKAINRWRGAPKYYTILGLQLQIYPVADQAYTSSFVYLARITPIATSPNWILVDHPDAYLYGALTQSAPYLKNDARLSVWGTLFTAAVDDICEADPMPSDKMTLRTDIPLSDRRLRLGDPALLQNC
jgi:hypothetical protein